MFVPKLHKAHGVIIEPFLFQFLHPEYLKVWFCPRVHSDPHYGQASRCTRYTLKSIRGTTWEEMYKAAFYGVIVTRSVSGEHLRTFLAWRLPTPGGTVPRRRNRILGRRCKVNSRHVPYYVTDFTRVHILFNKCASWVFYEVDETLKSFHLSLLMTSPTFVLKCFGWNVHSSTIRLRFKKKLHFN